MVWKTLIELNSLRDISREKHPKLELRGHEWHIWKPHSKKDRRRKFFDIRIIDLWNALPAEVVCKQELSN